MLISPHPLSPQDVKAIAARKVPTIRSASEVGPLPRQTWDSCSVFDSRFHVVTEFGGGVRLLCGKEGLRWGYWHIKSDHRAQFVTLTYNTKIGWEDLMYWAAWYSIKYPEAIRSNTATQKACRSHKLYLYNTVTGQMTSDKVYRTIYMWNKPAGASPASGTIITVLPDSRGHCDARSVA